jgi:dienelactone hydrolase/glycopeptide antibiotics resistance protein
VGKKGSFIMLGVVVLIILLGIEIGFIIYSLLTRACQKDKKSILRIMEFVLMTLFTLIGVIYWSFRWNMLFLILFIKAAMGLWHILKGRYKKQKIYKKRYVIMNGINNVFIIVLAVLPAILFPQFKPMEPTGDYSIKTVSYTLTDPIRLEPFTGQKENRKVTIQFWYPDHVNETYPLVVFSHGSFGYRGSNLSTFEDLASNGYVVCSIDHTHHAFITKQTDGKIIPVSNEFLNNAIAAQNDELDAKTTYNMTQEWLQLRLGDVAMVLDTILEKAASSDTDEVFQMINVDKIGLFGHSLGGATAAEMGRERSDIDAVIVIDGTMLGEEVGFVDGKEVLNSNPYPIPLLNIYNEKHFNDAKQNAETYANMVATANAIDARQVVVRASGHINFTDLPLFSPFLANLLDTGDINSRYCIETMNHIVLDYFNYYLKNTKELELQEEY